MAKKIEKENFFPQLSVVIVSISPYPSLINCLDSILSNENQDKIEIVVVNSSVDKHIVHLIERHPYVRFFQFPEKTGIAVLSAAGIARTTGKIIALTNSSCVVDSNWIESILNAHQLSTSVVVGGCVEIFKKMKLLDLAAYFCDYGQFMKPLKSGTGQTLPGNNISFKRSALEIGNEYVKNEFWKTFWCQKLQAEGIELRTDSSILVYDTKEYRLIPFLRRRFYQGRHFAAIRAKRMTVSKRWFYTSGTIILPFVFLWRTLASVLGKKRLLKELVLSTPFIVLAVVFWSIGEALGYVAGTGKSCDYIY